MADYTVTLSEDGSPNCAGDYTDAGELNGKRYYTSNNEFGMWYLWAALRRGVYTYHLSNMLGFDYISWVALSGENPIQQYGAGFGGCFNSTGIATVAEYVPPVATVVTNILLGGTPETCQILNSRIVRGPL